MRARAHARNGGNSRPRKGLLAVAIRNRRHAGAWSSHGLARGDALRLLAALAPLAPTPVGGLRVRVGARAANTRCHDAAVAVLAAWRAVLHARWVLGVGGVARIVRGRRVRAALEEAGFTACAVACIQQAGHCPATDLRAKRAALRRRRLDADRTEVAACAFARRRCTWARRRRGARRAGNDEQHADGCNQECLGPPHQMSSPFAPPSTCPRGCRTAACS